MMVAVRTSHMLPAEWITLDGKGIATEYAEREANTTRARSPYPASFMPDDRSSEADVTDGVSVAGVARPEAATDAVASGALARTPLRLAARLRWRVLLAAALLVAVLGVGASLLPGRHLKGAVAQRPSATATATLAPTPSPSPTATLPPGVTLMPGFRLYQDPGSGYLLQYPTAWPQPSTDPHLGVEFSDSNGAYDVQVNEPDPLISGVATGPDPTTAAADWVNFELTNFQQWEEARGFTFVRQPGPVPSAAIGGQAWQAGTAVISGQDATLQVYVYATIHQGRPYVINLLASSQVFSTGQQTYFDPMLKSFQFAPAGS